MTAEEYWKALCVKNPALTERETVTIRVSGLKAMIKQAHGKGYEHCREVTERIRKNLAAGGNPLDGLFK
ncbi:hypothetical protein SDC9_186244 [bioreactor metagenome]|uniref:Uncharacterized protein n=1 Tax=bioreactor metagenome TaxID=1076179 RepID=A0A645HKJ8_9ZZZZ